MSERRALMGRGPYAFLGSGFAVVLGNCLYKSKDIVQLLLQIMLRQGIFRGKSIASGKRPSLKRKVAYFA